MQEAIAGFSQKMRGAACLEDPAVCEHAGNVDGAALARAIHYDDALGTGTGGT